MGRLARALMAIAMASLLSGCAGGPAIFGSQTGTVTGHVMTRACGGAYRVDQNACQATPRSGVQLTFSGHGSTPRTVGVDNGGAYRIDLAAGTYTVKVETFGSSLSPIPGPTPRFSGPTQIVVSAGKTVTVDFTETVELL